MTREFVMSEMAKVGIESFKRYLWTVYRVSFESFGEWPLEEKKAALKDFFDSQPA